MEIGFKEVYYNGNGKTDWEIEYSIQNGVIMNVDSIFNAEQLIFIIERVKPLDKVKVLIRVNIHKDTGVHPYLKTGISNQCCVTVCLNATLF